MPENMHYSDDAKRTEATDVTRRNKMPLDKSFDKLKMLHGMFSKVNVKTGVPVLDQSIFYVF